MTKGWYRDSYRHSLASRGIRTNNEIKTPIKTPTDKIDEFQDEYRWLSNFAPVLVSLDGRLYPSVEHAYMSAKSDDPDWKEFCQNTEKPGKVKRASKDIVLPSDWETRKVEVMEELIDQKYDVEPYRSQLLETGNMNIQEGNRWHDTFWGVDINTGEGQNVLGKLIMEKRERLRND